MDEKFYHIEDVAKITGFTKRTLRYYEDIGLIKPSRTESSYRLYSEEDIKNITRIKALKSILGFSLLEIKETFNLELDLKKILCKDIKDDALIKNSIELIKHQIELIEEKEQSLKKVKETYKEILTKVEMLGGKDEK
ncbi:MerR family transcriptional regulator [Candidatus Clostridium radicumherbarum]